MMLLIVETPRDAKNGRHGRYIAILSKAVLFLDHALIGTGTVSTEHNNITPSTESNYFFFFTK